MKKLYIEQTDTHIRAALTKNGVLEEIIIDVLDGSRQIGDIVMGKIKTILPNRFAFIDVGEKHNAFMNLQKDHGLKAGMLIPVQVYKAAQDAKGAMVDVHMNLRGRYVVLSQQHAGSVGISKKISDDKQAKHLKEILRPLLPFGFGVIVRTGAHNASIDDIIHEMKRLHARYDDIIKKSLHAQKGMLLYPDDAQRMADIIADYVDVDEIIHCTKEHDFSSYGITKQIKKALLPEVPLSCGGFIIIEETHACVAVDVNSGSNINKQSLSETILDTNLNAAREIARQIRLRNLSGIIMIDFIDMKSKADQRILMDALKHEMSKDRIFHEIAEQINFGVVLIARKKTHKPLSVSMKTRVMDAC